MATAWALAYAKSSCGLEVLRSAVAEATRIEHEFSSGALAEALGSVPGREEARRVLELLSTSSAVPLNVSTTQ